MNNVIKFTKPKFIPIKNLFSREGQIGLYLANVKFNLIASLYNIAKSDDFVGSDEHKEYILGYRVSKFTTDQLLELCYINNININVSSIKEG